MNPKTVTLDVREDIRNGREPFSKIMAVVTALRADERFLLIAPFEPVPLYAVLGKQGFIHDARSLGSGDWEVLFTRAAQRSNTPPLPAAASASPQTRNPESANGNGGSQLTLAATEVVDVDARGLEPPQPMVKILEALAALPADAQLRARTDRRPMHLYAQLEARGFVGQTEEQSDGSFITRITGR